ncbi:glycosyltransferase family 4 protein [Candidatus Uhrbacteria bacterium]|jgi:glycosyltransferase involved in cell wall biosynthesis|nr:glycosyltransferase family 4 protein [Candidatus Uhrbacteria bacterium]
MIAIDAVPAAKEQKTGVEWYVYRLLKKMNELEPDLEVVLYSHRPLDFELKGRWTNKVLKWDLPGWSKIRWSWELFKDRPDVIFVPGDELPYVLPGKVVTTIHDLGFLHHPEYYSQDQLKRFKRAHSRAVNIADKVITITDTTRRDIISSYSADDSKIETIHFGYDKAMFKVRGQDDAEVARVKADYELQKPYLFYVGRLEDKKGIAPFLKAFTSWKDQGDHDVELVLGGTPGEVGYDKIHEIASSRDDIHEIGHVDYKDLGPLRSGALVEVFPTRFEGFGMPTLEAMASGVPFVCSDLEVLHEVGESAPMFVPLDAHGAWMRALDEMMKPETREEMIRKGLVRAQDFDWTTTAQRTLDVLCNI